MGGPRQPSLEDLGRPSRLDWERRRFTRFLEIVEELGTERAYAQYLRRQRTGGPRIHPDLFAAAIERLNEEVPPL